MTRRLAFEKHRLVHVTLTEGSHRIFGSPTSYTKSTGRCLLYSFFPRKITMIHGVAKDEGKDLDPLEFPSTPASLEPRIRSKFHARLSIRCAPLRCSYVLSRQQLWPGASDDAGPQIGVSKAMSPRSKPLRRFGQADTQKTAV